MKQEHTVESFITHLFNLFDKQADDVRDTYQITSDLARHICATDVVNGEFDHMRKFIELYKDVPDDPNGVAVENKIPADIVVDSTIPIQTLGIGIDESTHAYNKATVFIDEGIRDLTSDDYNDLKDDNLSSTIVGVVQITDAWVFPIGMSYVPNEGAYFVHVVNIPVNTKMPYGQYVKIIKTWSPYLMVELSDMVNTAVTLLNIWYGIQISLLHPVTKTVFDHAAKEKVPREILKKQVGRNRAKYVRVHHITDENNAKQILLDTANDLLKTSSSKKRKYVRKRLLWRVIGHYRNAGGKRVFINGYWKGPLKDIEEKRGVYKENDRVIEETTYKK